MKMQTRNVLVVRLLGKFILIFNFIVLMTTTTTRLFVRVFSTASASFFFTMSLFLVFLIGIAELIVNIKDGKHTEKLVERNIRKSQSITCEDIIATVRSLMCRIASCVVCYIGIVSSV
jgi:hypothetical protein